MSKEAEGIRTLSMPDLQAANIGRVAAIIVGDIHASDRPPPARDEDKKAWYATMFRYFGQLRAIRSRFQYNSQSCPIICTGDIFDRWDSPPELINFLLQWMPPMYSVAGNHDLPNHSLEQMDRSAFGTLMQAGKVEFISSGEPIPLPDSILSIHGFSNGEKILPLPKPIIGMPIAVVHAYCWTKGHSHPGALMDDYVTEFADKLRGYSTAVIGDNHKGFIWKSSKITVFGNGTFVRRRSDERDYRPWVGLLMQDTSIIPVYLDTSEDKFVDIPSSELAAAGLDADEFLETLRDLQDVQLDFEEATKVFMRTNKVSKAVSVATLSMLRAKR